jgi:hypothetical protein
MQNAVMTSSGTYGLVSAAADVEDADDRSRSCAVLAHTTQTLCLGLRGDVGGWALEQLGRPVGPYRSRGPG